MKIKKQIIERPIYSEFFIEILWRTPPYYDMRDDYIGYLMNTNKSTLGNCRRYVAETFNIGLTRRELKDRIDAWTKIIGSESKNKGSSYSKKIKNLIQGGLVKAIDYPMINKQYRYIINKYGVVNEIISLIVTDKSILKIYYKDLESIKLYLNDDEDLYYFDKFIWDFFQDSIMRMSRYREDFREKINRNSQPITSLKERDTNIIIKSSIKEYIQHFIFYHAMLYFNQINTGNNIKFPGSGSSENRYYNEFLRCCWLYIEHNVFSSWLMAPFLDITNESPKLEVGKK